MTTLGFLPDVYADLGVAVAIGLLLGLQRERHFQDQRIHGMAGARTFPIVALLGAASALLTPQGTPWVAVAGLLAVAALSVSGYLRETREGTASIGLTSETLLLLTFVLGATAVRTSGTAVMRMTEINSLTAMIRGRTAGPGSPGKRTSRSTTSTRCERMRESR